MTLMYPISASSIRVFKKMFFDVLDAALACVLGQMAFTDKYEPFLIDLRLVSVELELALLAAAIRFYCSDEEIRQANKK